MEMSFLSGIYSKVLGTSSKKTEQRCSDSGTGSVGFTEAFDNEDGFVLYTPDQHKRYKVCIIGLLHYKIIEIAIPAKVFWKAGVFQLVAIPNSGRSPIFTFRLLA